MKGNKEERWEQVRHLLGQVKGSREVWSRERESLWGRGGTLGNLFAPGERRQRCHCMTQSSRGLVTSCPSSLNCPLTISSIIGRDWEKEGGESNPHRSPSTNWEYSLSAFFDVQSNSFSQVSTLFRCKKKINQSTIIIIIIIHNIICKKCPL